MNIYELSYFHQVPLFSGLKRNFGSTAPRRVPQLTKMLRPSSKCKRNNIRSAQFLFCFFSRGKQQQKMEMVAGWTNWILSKERMVSNKRSPMVHSGFWVYIYVTGWWFHFFLYPDPWGNDPIWRAYFSTWGWNHRPDYICSVRSIPYIHLYCTPLGNAGQDGHTRKKTCVKFTCLEWCFRLSRLQPLKGLGHVRAGCLEIT